MKHFSIVSQVIMGLLVLTIPSSTYAQIPNAGFEQWTAGNPVGWYTTNTPGLGTPVSQTNQAHGGSSALRGEVVNTIVGPWSPIIQSGEDAQGFPVSQRYATFSGFFRFSPVGGDRFGVNVVIYSNGNPVGVGAIANPATVSSYTQFDAVISYFDPSVPDTCIIQISIVGPTGSDYHVGSTMFVDDLSLSGVGSVEDGAGAPFAYKLTQNYPNPFNPTTTISFTLPSRSHVSLKVFDALGREVSVLLSEELPAGTHSRQWNAAGLSSGLYFYRLQTADFAETKKLVLLR